MTKLWYDMCQNQSTGPAWCEADFDPSRLSYLECLMHNISSGKSRTQTILLKMRTLCPPLCNFCKIFSEKILPGGLVSCSEVIGAQSILQVVSPSATVLWIKWLISLVLTYVVHCQQHELRYILQIRGWGIVYYSTFWAPSWNSWGWENYQIWHPRIGRKCSFHILPYNKSFELV